MLLKIKIFILSILLFSCSSIPQEAHFIGRFNVEKDLFLPQFDSKTDVDDIHSIAGVATMLSDPRFKDVNFHAVAGAYGTQEGLYVPANNLFELSFKNNWSDAHSDFNKALKEVTDKVMNVLRQGGNIWISEAGQSDFSAAMIKNIKEKMPEIDTKTRINIVQHSDWNESSASPENLHYVKENIAYHKIPDGNFEGNGSPGLKTDESINLEDYYSNPEILNIWTLAKDIANKYNGVDNRYKNPDIEEGGLDFSDVSETCWIFGFENLKNCKQFFEEFSSSYKN